MNHSELGVVGEKLALNHLIEKGYKIIETNYRFKKNEIDIIAEFKNQIIIVEVKTRQTSELGEPWLAVTRTKQKSIIQVANHYVQMKNIDLDARFDIISIIHNNYKTNIEHIEDAFSC